MTSADGKTTIAFNGEIYNYPQLREELLARGLEFRTKGDTEVLLNLYRAVGAEMVDKLVGMFAFCLYDVQAGTLILARDRLGQKPLWYAILPDRLIFASEPKALLPHPMVGKNPDNMAITTYLTMGYINYGRSGWRGISKLPPASLMICRQGACKSRRYWSPPTPAELLPSGRAEIVESVRCQVTEAVEMRMLSDVPLGALLSGGVDSAIIVALMSTAAGQGGGVKTFTAGFEDARYDERPAARSVAEHCGTDHTELLVRPQPKGMLDWVVSRYDEPFADSSALPTRLICEAAHQHVTVALTGDGGDEAFGGYDRYRAMHLSQTMSPLEYLVVKVASGVSRPFAPLDERSRLRRLIRLAEGLSFPPAMQYFRYRRLFGPVDLLRLLSEAFLVDIDATAPAEWFCELYGDGEFDDEAVNAQRCDLLTYLPDDLLVKADIASMSVSLELRAPMLDHRVVELGLKLPVEMKLNRRRGKLILREAFGELLPQEVFERPKRGFGVPLGRWLREELRAEMVETLTDPALKALGIFREEALVGLMNDHLSRRADHRHRLWALMVLARWLIGQS